MTQAEIELITRELRTKCLHSSWNDLVSFWGRVLGNLDGAYRALAESTTSSHRMPTGDLNSTQGVVRDKLAAALSELAGGRSGCWMTVPRPEQFS